MKRDIVDLGRILSLSCPAGNRNGVILLTSLLPDPNLTSSVAVSNDDDVASCLLCSHEIITSDASLFLSDSERDWDLVAAIAKHSSLGQSIRAIEKWLHDYGPSDPDAAAVGNVLVKNTTNIITSRRKQLQARQRLRLHPRHARVLEGSALLADLLAASDDASVAVGSNGEAIEAASAAVRLQRSVVEGLQAVFAPAHPYVIEAKAKLVRFISAYLSTKKLPIKVLQELTKERKSLLNALEMMMSQQYY